MNLFELFVKIGVDDKASSNLKSITSKLGNGLKTAAKIGTAAVGAAAAGITALTTAAVKNYAEYEQLVGGVETLFKDSADRVKQYANEAYRSAGLSANEYMSTVTSFSASLLQSLGRGAQTDLEALEKNLDEQYDATKKGWDERIALAKKMKKANVQELIDQRDAELKALKEGAEQRLKQAEEANNKSVVTAETQALAADLANQVVIDMSDNVAKMGNNMEMVQNAYRGFARGQYQLLDNLALGYNGTAEEAKRLVKDAARLDSSIDANSLSFDNFVKAIHVVQVEMGIAGTTAKEAGRTIEGSVNAMKSAWTNLVTGIADKNADLEQLVGNLVMSIVGDGTENNLGVLGNIMPAVKTALSGASRLVSELLPIIVEQIPSIILENLPILAQAAVSIVQSLVDGISQNQEMLMTTAMETITYLATSLSSMLPDIVKLGLDLIVSLANGISEAINKDGFIDTIIDVVLQIVETLTDPSTLESLLNGAIAIITSIANYLLQPDVINMLLNAAIGVVNNLVTFLMKNLSPLLNAAIDIIMALVDYLLDPENLGKLVETAVELVVTIAGALVGAAGELVGAVGELIFKMIEKFKETNWIELGKNVVVGFKNGIANAWNNLVQWFSKLFDDLIGIAKRILGIASPSKAFKRLGAWSAEGFGVGFEDAFGDVEKDIENALDFSGTTFGVDAYGTYSGGGMLGGVGGTSFGTVNINIDGYNAQDDDELAEMIAEKLQTMTERRGAVFA